MQYTGCNRLSHLNTLTRATRSFTVRTMTREEEPSPCSPRTVSLSQLLFPCFSLLLPFFRRFAPNLFTILPIGKWQSKNLRRQQHRHPQHPPRNPCHNPNHHSNPFRHSPSLLQVT